MLVCVDLEQRDQVVWWEDVLAVREAVAERAQRVGNNLERLGVAPLLCLRVFLRDELFPAALDLGLDAVVGRLEDAEADVVVAVGGCVVVKELSDVSHDTINSIEGGE